MNAIQTDYLKEEHDFIQQNKGGVFLNDVRNKGFEQFNQLGVPSFKAEEWKYTTISNLFKRPYHISKSTIKNQIPENLIVTSALAGNTLADEIVMVNGRFVPELSTIRSSKEDLIIMTFEEAVNSDYKSLIEAHLDKSSLFINDGIHALNTAFIQEGVFIYVPKNKVLSHPIYVEHILDARENHLLAQPRSLIFVEEGAKVQVVESFKTIGAMDSFLNEVMEIVVKENSIMEYYKIQNDGITANQVGTTHIRQIGKSYVHTVTISLDGGMIRNNIDIIMEVEGNEAHMYGLYLLKGRTHVDNHTLVDNTKPHCFSNELYKGILDDSSTGVFSGKIFVRPDAQKTNAYQSNKNILLTEMATVNTKPQLEIFADDVKCSHGCTVGRLDQEALFYLMTRGISKENARAMLLNAFASDIVSQIKIEPLRYYVENLISQRLDLKLSE